MPISANGGGENFGRFDGLIHRDVGCTHQTPHMSPKGVELAGVGFAFGPGLGGVFFELPVEEAGAEAAGDGLGVLGALVVAEVVVGEAEGFGELPAVAVRAGEEGVEPRWDGTLFLMGSKSWMLIPLLKREKNFVDHVDRGRKIGIYNMNHNKD